VDRQPVVDLGQQRVAFPQDHFDLLSQDLRVEQVLDPDAEPGCLVPVGGPDAAPGGADAVAAEVALGELVPLLVPGHDQVGVRRDQQLPGRDPPRAPSAASPARSPPGSITTPLPITGTTCGYRTPLGTRWSLKVRPPTMTVWPALLPPW